MAVLVQRMIEPEAAGVAFTRDPRNARRLVVEAHPGRGDAVVSGRARPDRYVVERETGRPANGRAGGSLSASALQDVAALALRVERLLAAPQDVEWALAADGLYLLQARPITVEAEDLPAPGLRLLTRANVGEVLPDPVTPLTWSTVGAFLEHGFRRVAARAGLLPASAGPFLVLHRRRLYLNLSLCLDVAGRLPGVSAADAERLVLGGGVAGEARARVGVRAGLRLVAIVIRLLGLRRSLPRDMATEEAAASTLSPPAAIAAMDDAALGAALRDLEGRGRRVAEVHILASGASAFRLAALGRLLASTRPRDAGERVNRLLAGLDDVESALPALALEELAAATAADPDWASWLSRSADHAPHSFTRAAPPGLSQRLREFLDRHGHRGLSEGELAAPSWEDDPSPVLAALRTLAAAPRRPGWTRSARTEIRRADTEALLSRRGPVGRALLRAAIDGAQEGVRERERTKAMTVRLVRHGRRLAREAARRLVAAGRLGERDDVFFLTVDELVRALGGQSVPSSLVRRRRRRHEREGALPAPRLVDASRGPEDEAAPAPRGGNEASLLAGIGVSAGAAAGPARVLLPGAPLRVDPGDVLVAPVLDAAFGPLLATAAAAVAEIGGMLSHGSVVARELGVPCVVDVRDATRRIRTGERLLVDGGRGTVERLEGAGEGAGANAGAARGSSPPPIEVEDEAAETFHVLEPDRRARESVYLNLQDPASGIALLATLGTRAGGRGEGLVAVALADGRVLFGLVRGPAVPTGTEAEVGGLRASLRPARFRAKVRLAPHEPAAFPPPPLPLLLAPRTVDFSADLSFRATTPAIDLCRGLPPASLEAIRPLGHHHLEQAGLWTGEVVVDGRRYDVEAVGGRDHSWGLRDWEALDHSRLFTAWFGSDLTFHALTLSVGGRAVEGGFVWRSGRAERITRVLYTTEREGGVLRGCEVELTTAAGGTLRARGRVARDVTVPIELERRAWRHAAGRPYRLVLHEGFCRYEAEGRSGLGLAEISERPL
jgi:pyruvate,water dikinase